MAYRFKIDEPIATGVQRVARGQVVRAGRELEAASGAAVHESRKAIKRLRALLRLIRPEIGEKAFKARNAAMREIAAALSGPRDQGILLESVAKLEARYGAETAGILAPVRDLIGADAAGSQASIGRAAIEQVRDLLAREEKRFETLEIAGDGFTVLADGLEQSYRRGRKALAKARENPSDQAYHDLRKAVQWHWRQMAVLSRAWPSYFGVRVEAARELSQILGDDHDLAVLLTFAKKEALAPGAVSAPLERLVRSRQEELRREAIPRAGRLFTEQPRRFTRRIADYWAAACHVIAREDVSPGKPRDPAARPTNGAANGPQSPVLVSDDDPSPPRS